LFVLSGWIVAFHRRAN